MMELRFSTARYSYTLTFLNMILLEGLKAGKERITLLCSARMSGENMSCCIIGKNKDVQYSPMY